MKEFFLAALSIVASLLLVLLLVCLGWYIVWTFFLSRFNFVRELLGTVTNGQSNGVRATAARTKPRRD